MLCKNNRKWCIILDVGEAELKIRRDYERTNKKNNRVYNKK